jgi:hypothetical protein
MSFPRSLSYATAALLGLFVTNAPAQAHGRFSIGLNFGLPIFAPWPAYYPYYHPVYVAPPPVYVAPQPVYIQPTAVAAPPAPACQPAYYNNTAPPPLATTTARAAAPDNSPVEGYLQQLTTSDDRVRADVVMQLGRMRATTAVDPLAATLAGDRSPVVREAAARALALIGSPKALPALQQAALTDADRDVRRSAQFAIDVVQSGR